MKPSVQKRALACAVQAARAVGSLMRQNLHGRKKINSKTHHDIKLDLDVRSQKLIEKTLAASFPEVALLGEEGTTGDSDAAARWVVDPIDGTVNFAYGIPHACISIALQTRGTVAAHLPSKARRFTTYADGYETLVGVVYDPFCDELWTGIRGQPARLNGRSIRVSNRTVLSETIVAIGFAKTPSTIEHTLPHLKELIRRTRKVRLMGAAALDMTYVATGRFDAYIERGIRLWDIAAGGLIVECAGGEFWREAIPGEHTYRLVASNGRIRKKLAAFG